MKRIDIKIGFACNNLCDFCAQGHKRGDIRARTPAEIKKLLAGAAKKGVTGVVFTGGEPTLHPWLPRAAAEARRLGYACVQVQTNGRRLSSAEYCAELKEAGVTEVSPALHGSTAALHDRLTRAPGSFAQTVAGIRRAKAAGFRILTNTVVTSLNYRDLPALARLLIYLGADQYQLAFVHVIGTAWEKRFEIVPRKSDALPYMKKALDEGIKAGVPCYTEAVPYCLMKGYEQCVAEAIIPEGPVADAGLYLENYADYRRNSGKAKRPDCRRCRWDARCEGPWHEYPELYGWDEFKPVPPPRERRK